MMRVSGTRNQTVDALRGFAAVIVCLCHSTYWNTKFHVGAMAPIFGWGHVGVEIFFVITGFIVPMTMYAHGYCLADWTRFIAKRVTRLDPPYFAAIALMLAISVIGARMPEFHGSPPQLMSYAQLLCHPAYTCAFFDVPWLDGVFWTLAIEFQFYLFVSLAFSLLVRWPVLSCLALLGVGVTFAPTHVLAVPYMPLFATGLLTFHFKRGALTARNYAALMFATATAILYQFDTLTMAFTIAAACAIAFIEIRRVAPLAFLGAVSYSLYLVHPPIVLRVTNLASRLELTPMIELAVVLAALLLSLITAYLFCLVIEQPAIRWSQRISSQPIIFTHQDLRVSSKQVTDLETLDVQLSTPNAVGRALSAGPQASAL
jgi:peptidoglycan/LPS O-acetylase OafA/YrhL